MSGMRTIDSRTSALDDGRARRAARDSMRDEMRNEVSGEVSGDSYFSGTEYGALFDEEPVLRIDRRFVDRREDVERSALRQRARRQIAAGSLAALVLFGAVLLRSGVFTVRTVDVFGADRVSADVIRRAADVHGGPAIWQVDSDAISRRIEQLPWIESVIVERDFPKRVTVTVREYQPVAVAISGNQQALIASNGRVLELGNIGTGALPEIMLSDRSFRAGINVAHPEALMVAARLPASLRSLGARVDARNPGAIVVSAGGVEIRLGRPEQVDRKLAAAVAVLNVPESCRTYIDVSVPLAPVSGCASAPNS